MGSRFAARHRGAADELAARRVHAVATSRLHGTSGIATSKIHSGEWLEHRPMLDVNGGDDDTTSSTMLTSATTSLSPTDEPTTSEDARLAVTSAFVTAPSPAIVVTRLPISTNETHELALNKLRRSYARARAAAAAAAAASGGLTAPASRLPLLSSVDVGARPAKIDIRKLRLGKIWHSATSLGGEQATVASATSGGGSFASGSIDSEGTTPIEVAAAPAARALRTFGAQLGDPTVGGFNSAASLPAVVRPALRGGFVRTPPPPNSLPPLQRKIVDHDYRQPTTLATAVTPAASASSPFFRTLPHPRDQYTPRRPLGTSPPPALPPLSARPPSPVSNPKLQQLLACCQQQAAGCGHLCSPNIGKDEVEIETRASPSPLARFADQTRHSNKSMSTLKHDIGSSMFSTLLRCQPSQSMLRACRDDVAKRRRDACRRVTGRNCATPLAKSMSKFVRAAIHTLLQPSLVC